MNRLLPLLMVVDDDASVRRGLQRLLEAEGHEVEVFASAEACLEHLPAMRPACLVLDVKMPGMSGLDLQQALAAAGRDDAIIFITGHGDVPQCAQAMKNGAVDFLLKPFSNEALLAAVAAAMNRARRSFLRDAIREKARAKLAVLSEREMEVFRWIIAGLMNKQICEKLGTAEKTVKNHRAHIIAKLGLGSVAEMVRIAQEAGFRQGPGR